MFRLIECAKASLKINYANYNFVYSFQTGKEKKKTTLHTHTYTSKQAISFFSASFLSLNEEIRRKKKTEWHKSTTDDSCLHFDSVKIEKEENGQRKKERRSIYISNVNVTLRFFCSCSCYCWGLADLWLFGFCVDSDTLFLYNIENQQFNRIKSWQTSTFLKAIANFSCVDYLISLLLQFFFLVVASLCVSSWTQTISLWCKAAAAATTTIQLELTIFVFVLCVRSFFVCNSNGMLCSDTI